MQWTSETKHSFPKWFVFVPSFSFSCVRSLHPFPGLLISSPPIFLLIAYQSFRSSPHDCHCPLSIYNSFSLPCDLRDNTHTANQLNLLRILWLSGSRPSSCISYYPYSHCFSDMPLTLPSSGGFGMFAPLLSEDAPCVSLPHLVCSKSLVKGQLLSEPPPSLHKAICLPSLPPNSRISSHQSLSYLPVLWAFICLSNSPLDSEYWTICSMTILGHTL